MICPIEESQDVLEVDVFINRSGGISFEPLFVNKESEGCYAASLETLVQEFIDFQKNPETGRIENPQVGPAFMLRDALMRSLEILEDEIFDD